MDAMSLFDVASSFYARSKSATASSHWEHLDQFGPEMFRDPQWLDSFLSRWVSVGFNDTTMQVADRFRRKAESPLGAIVLDRKCVEFDLAKAASVGALLEQFEEVDFAQYLGCPLGRPIAPVRLSGATGDTNTSFHEMSLLYMGLRLRALVAAAEVDSPLRMLEVGGGYGGLIEKLIRLMADRIDVVYLVDLPFNLTIQYWFLEGCRRAGWHDLDLLADSPPKASPSRAVVFVPTDDLDCIGELDVAINARSLGEMLPADVARYLRLIQKRTRPGGVFYNMNRYAKQNAAGDVLRLKEYPYDERWSLLSATTVSFFTGIGEMALVRRTGADPMFRKALAALPPHAQSDSACPRKYAS